MRVLLGVLGDLLGPGLAVGVAHALADRDHAAIELLIHRLDLAEELADRDRPLGEVQQVWAVVVLLLAQGRGGGQKARVPAHDHVDLHAGQGPVVQVVAHQGAGHEPTGGAEAGAVVGHEQVVVHGLGDVEGSQVVAGLFGHVVDDVRSVSRVVAADVEEVADVAFLEHFEDAAAVFRVGFVPAGSQSRGGRGCHGLQSRSRELAQIDELVLDHAGHGVDRPIDPLDFRVLPGLFNDADQRGVDHARRPAGLPYYRISFWCVCHIILHTKVDVRPARPAAHQPVLTTSNLTDAVIIQPTGRDSRGKERNRG